MFLNNIRKSKRTISFLLLSVLVSETAYPAAALRTSAQGQDGTPLSASANSMVDPYTGDFNYSVPLLTVPGPNGENVPVTASYHAGIRVDDKASWLGLGWEYNPGEITRQTMGVPDDASPYPAYTFNAGGRSMGYYFGSIYNNNINTVIPATSNNLVTQGNGLTPNCTSTGTLSYFFPATKSSDLQSYDYTIPFIIWNTASNSANGAGSLSQIYNGFPSRFRRYTLPYQTLAYDRYYISGAMSGQLKPYNLSGPIPYSNLGATETGKSVNSKRTQFYLENSSALTVPNASSANVNPTTNRIRSGSFVKYYTNAELNTASNFFSNSTQTGFIDYQTVSGSTRRPAASYDPDGIGAFEVTDASGITYHYSLPVYSYEEVDRVVDQTPSSNETLPTVTYKPKRYATSWKLTAVTGPDYQDVNNNFVVDAADAGYWISYNYSLWTDNLQWSNAQYNYKKDQLLPNSINYLALTNNSNFIPPGYSPQYTVQTGKTQVYYLNHIKTATHTAFFVKSVRKDEQGYEQAGSPSGTTKPSPLLKLDRVVLLRNEDAYLFGSAVPLSGSDLDSRFDYSNSTTAMNENTFVGASKYSASRIQIDAASLKTAELVSDYKLCKKYYNNINNTFTTSKSAISPAANNNYCLYKQLLTTDILYRYYDKTAGNFSSTDAANSGKLTLNSINLYEFGKVKIMPSVDFDYDASTAAKNPDYDPDKTDLWGYYKSDYTTGGSHYTSSVSRNDVDAWSLKTITTAMGGKIIVNYESDVYHAEGFADDPALMSQIPDTPNTQPTLIFPIASINTTIHHFDNVVFEDGDVYSFLNAYKSSTATTGQFPKAYLICPFRDYCGTYKSDVVDLGMNTYYTNYGYALIDQPSLPTASLSAYNFNYNDPDGTGIGLKYEIDIQPLCASGTGVISQAYDKASAYSYVLMRANYLYGGGLRVKSITMNEPSLNENYTQSFEYDKGYCPVVPKRFALGTNTGPSSFNLLLNTRLGLEGVGSTVGYSHIKMQSLGRNNTTTGATEYWFENKPIHLPISITNNSIQVGKTTSQIEDGTYRPGSILVNIPGCPTPTLQFQFHDNSYTAVLQYNNAEINLLGKIKKIAPFGGPVTEFEYKNTSYIDEVFGLLNGVVATDKCWFHTSTSCGTYANTYNYDTYRISSRYRNYDCFVSATVKTMDGISIRERVVARDPATAQTTISKTLDPTKGIYISRSTPAYQNTGSYAVLGLKADNETNRNQLVLTETSHTIKYPYTAQTANDNANNFGPAQGYIVAENKATFSNQYPVRSYNAATNTYTTATQTTNWYRPDETYTRALNDITTEGTGSPVWRKTTKGTLYDEGYRRLEASGLNDRKASSKLGYNNLYQLASAGNANYYSYTFSSFEDQVTQSNGNIWFGGEVANGQMRSTGTNYAMGSFLANVKPHSGDYVAAVTGNVVGPYYDATQFETGRTYIAKVWIHNTAKSDARLAIDLTGSLNSGTAVNLHKEVFRSDLANIKVGKWVQMTVEIPVPADFNLAATHLMRVYVQGSTGAGSTTYFDDLSFHPKDISFSGSVYQANTGWLVATLDNENFGTYFNYDVAGRLTSSYKETAKGTFLISEKSYHFAKP